QRLYGLRLGIGDDDCSALIVELLLPLIVLCQECQGMGSLTNSIDRFRPCPACDGLMCVVTDKAQFETRRNHILSLHPEVSIAQRQGERRPQPDLLTEC